MDLHGLDDSYLTTYVQKVHAVTPDEVKRIMNAYLRDNEMTIVIAGDVSKIKQQVESYGNVIM